MKPLGAKRQKPHPRILKYVWIFYAVFKNLYFAINHATTRRRVTAANTTKHPPRLRLNLGSQDRLVELKCCSRQIKLKETTPRSGRRLKFQDFFISKLRQYND